MILKMIIAMVLFIKTIATIKNIRQTSNNKIKDVEENIKELKELSEKTSETFIMKILAILFFLVVLLDFFICSYVIKNTHNNVIIILSCIYAIKSFYDIFRLLSKKAFINIITLNKIMILQVSSNYIINKLSSCYDLFFYALILFSFAL